MIPSSSRPSSAVSGIDPIASRAWVPDTLRPSSQVTTHSVVDPLDAGRPGTDEQLHASFEEVVFEHRRYLRVAVRKDLLATDDQGDIRAEALEDVDELDAGHA